MYDFRPDRSHAGATARLFCHQVPHSLDQLLNTFFGAGKGQPDRRAISA
jgi:hypothetical protein